MSGAITDWASIVLAALPYVVFGALAAWLSRCIFRRSRYGQSAVALLAMVNPGCDCALNGFAGALAAARPALAGFSLTFAAAASPAALVVTYAAFGMRMTIARAGGAFIAAALTAIAWKWVSVAHPTTDFVGGRASLAHGVGGRASLAHLDCVGGQPSLAHRVGPTFMVGQTGEEHRPNEIGDLASAVRAVACAAAAAVAVKAVVPVASLAHMNIAAAGLLGALLSPCSTVDPLLAIALVRDTRSQLAFMLAAQCLDVRQLLLMLRHFGVAKMAAAAACAASACALATLIA